MAGGRVAGGVRTHRIDPTTIMSFRAMSFSATIVRPVCVALALVSGAALYTAVPAVAQGTPHDVVILYTNDFHSALDPIPAYWLPGSPRLGGAAALAGYVDRIRRHEPTVFLFDSGDMFTGLVSNLTRGEALMEMMRDMRYDAMAIGNHEFDYGDTVFERAMYRVPFPVLGANIFYHGTRHRYSRPYVILERDGIRVGVIGVIGQDARSVALPSGITDLDFDDPAAAIAPIVRELRPQVDLLVVLAHQGKTGPMQTDAEAHPELQRDFDEDVRLAGAVPGIDVLVGGHAHRGIERPYVHPRTGTIIVQTYGYGTRLGYLKLRVSGGRVVRHEGRLIPVWTDSVAPDRRVQATVDHYERAIAPRAGAHVLTLSRRLYRSYNTESPLGDVVADAMRDAAGADVALQNSGGLRADLAAGRVTTGNVLDALPFVNTLDTYRLTGAQLREVLEQSLTLERGIMQVSGLRVRYDLSRPRGSRVVDVRVGGRPLDESASYVVATNSFIGQGGDLYTTFTHAKRLGSGASIADIVVAYLRRAGDAVSPPPVFVARRLVPVDTTVRRKR